MSKSPDTIIRAITLSLLLILVLAIGCSDEENPTESVNYPPVQPTIDPAPNNPPNGSIGQTITPILGWRCSDPDGDALQYDVYFGSISTPPLVSNNQTGSGYTSGTLNYSTKYYWKIIAKDSKGASTNSNLWHFTTKSAPIENISYPNTPSGADSGLVDQTLDYSTGGSSSSLGHAIKYQFDWGDGNYSSWSSSDATHAWSQSDTYIVRAHARCVTHTNIVSSWSGNKSIVVSEIEKPVLAVSPTNLDFDSSNTNLSFTITNTGTGTLSWSISDDQNWIIVSHTSGSTTTETDEITVSIDRSGLSVGTHSGIITISSNSGDETVSVSLEVLPDPPICSIEPAILQFGNVLVGKSKDLSFTITNTGGGTLEGSVIEDCNQYNVTTSSRSYSLSNGESKSITVRFSPIIEGVDNCIIETQSACSNVGLSGTGTTPPCGYTVTSPSLSDVWTKGDSKTITWDSESGGSEVKIELYRGSSFRCSISSSTANDGSYSWTVDDCDGGEEYNYRIRITDLGDNTCYALSEYFNIDVNCVITVTNPTPSSSWIKDASKEIRWDPANCNAPNVEILLTRGQSVDTLKGVIATSTINDGLFSWVVDDFGDGTSSDYRIYISDSDNPADGGRSEHFTIVNNDPQTITLSATADANISSNYPDINLGSESTLLVGRTTDEGWLPSYIKVSGLMSSVPSGANIISAELILTRRYWAGSITMQIKPAKRNWLESTITYITQPGEYNEVVTYSNPVGGSNPEEIVIDVTQHVQDWIDDIRPDYGFSIWPDGTTGFDNVVQFYTKENANTSIRPKLIVTYKAP